MRPADENQHSTRPNLMSSGRRAGSEQSILEMLDRDSGRGTRRKSPSRLAWYGAGGALAACLIGLLVWLTHDGPPPQEAQPVVVADTASAVERPSKADATTELVALTDLDEPPRPHHAAVVDEAPTRQQKQAAPTAMLAAAPATPAATHGALVRDEPDTADSSRQPPTVQASPRTGALVAAAHSPQQSADRQPRAASGHDAEKSLAMRAPADAAKGRAGVRLAQSSGHGAPRKAARPPRAHKAAAPAKAAQPVVDSDVALISAVIQHATARPDGDCADGSCAAKTTTQP